MRNEKTDGRKNWKLAGAALCSALFIATTGCICITIGTPHGPQAGSGPGSRPGSGSGGGGPGGAASVGGGVFMPVQNAFAGGGQTTVCGKPVSPKYVRFMFDVNGQTLLTQTPDPTVTGFVGSVIDLTDNGAIVPTNRYYLQWFVNSLPQNNGCATNINNSPTEVGFTVTATGLPHRFTAYFKPTTPPQIGHQYQLQGMWKE